jgi:serine phosphatase RsbU (regulator of sigma subunit)
VEKYLVNSFIIYQPKDIVAGDFYWMEVIDDYIVFALADCTGHGVPGAMVSVVCHNALNRAVRDFKLLDPGEILNKTRDIVIEQFQQSEESVSDGMDISLCVYDRKNNMLRWAGANSPLLVMSNGVLNKLKPDKQPVGKFTNTSAFTSLDLKLNNGDIIYMYSDGYIDQFGGHNQEKLKYRRLCELIAKFHTESMSSQKLLFEKTFEDWKGENEQIDDMCMIGVKFEN